MSEVRAVHIDEEALQSSVQRLRQSAFEADVAGVMKRAVNSVHGVFGANGAGTMFVTESGQLSYVAASDEPGRQLEEAQAAAGQGPCYDSYVYAREVASSDLHADDRWPDLPAHLIPEVRAVAGIPILLGGSPVGTLNVYRDQHTDWDSSDIQALRAYSDLIAEATGAALAAHEHSVLADSLDRLGRIRPGTVDYAFRFRRVSADRTSQEVAVCGIWFLRPFLPGHHR
jgi:GAF domain-containing protein